MDHLVCYAFVFVMLLKLGLCSLNCTGIQGSNDTMNYRCSGVFNHEDEALFGLPASTVTLDLSSVIMTSHYQLQFTCGLTNLSVLILRNNSIENMNKFLCTVPFLEVLDLSNNKLTSLGPDSFMRTKSLRRLEVQGNRIDVIRPDTFNNLKRLEYLDLSRNKLSGIQLDSLNGLVSLKTLNLSRNSLFFLVVGAFSSLNSLAEIDLAENRINFINKYTFVGAESLMYVNLSKNEIENSTFDFTETFIFLEALDLSANKMNVLNTKSFTTSNIRAIYLNDMPTLKYVMKEAFCGCERLETIHLKNNRNLVYLDKNWILNAGNLKKLDISFTNVSVLPDFNSTTNISVNVNGCRLYCDCMLNEIQPGVFLTGSDRAFCKDNSTLRVWEFMLLSHNVTSCVPHLISNIKPVYNMFVGDQTTIECFVVGHPWPEVEWVRQIWNGTQSMYETLSQSHLLHVHVTSLSISGVYGCLYTSGGNSLESVFEINVKKLDMAVRVLARASTSIVITWNKTHHALHHVVIYRPYGTETEYQVHQLNPYWKIFRISGLLPNRHYEVCIASAADIDDHNCARVATTTESDVTGIHSDSGVIAVLCISGATIGVFLLATLYRCIKRLHVQTRSVFIVNSESRECFGDVCEATFTYENQYTDLMLQDDGESTNS